MSFMLTEIKNSRDNNFNLLRFLAALMVLFGHSYALSNSHIPHEWLFGHVAVDIFFIISGYLVTASLFTRKSLWVFVQNRFLRIFPGLFVAMIFNVFIIGVLYTDISILEYLKSTEIYHYIYANTTLLLDPIQMILPGVFTTNPHPNTVNGSLWTLPWEIAMYLLLFIIGIYAIIEKPILSFNIAKKLFLLISIIGMLVFGYYLYNHLDVNNSGVRFVAIFFTGGALWIYRKYILLSHRIFFGMLFLIYFSFSSSYFLIIYSLLIGYIVLYIAYVPKGTIRAFNKLGDYSYGMYIYAFPIQQAYVASFPEIKGLILFLLSSVTTLFLSVLSWHFIEKPALSFKKSDPIK